MELKVGDKVKIKPTAINGHGNILPDIQNQMGYLTICDVHDPCSGYCGQNCATMKTYRFAGSETFWCFIPESVEKVIHVDKPRTFQKYKEDKEEESKLKLLSLMDRLKKKMGYI